MKLCEEAGKSILCAKVAMEFAEISLPFNESDGWMGFKAVVPGVEFLFLREKTDGCKPRRCG
jgi:hypothetical protein